MGKYIGCCTQGIVGDASVSAEEIPILPFCIIKVHSGMWDDHQGQGHVGFLELLRDIDIEPLVHHVEDRVRVCLSVGEFDEL